MPRYNRFSFASQDPVAILEKIEPIEPGLRLEAIPKLMLLATPATLAFVQSKLPDIVQQLFKSRPDVDVVQVIVAGVDRVTGPAPTTTTSPNTTSHVSDSTLLTRSHEGFAYTSGFGVRMDFERHRTRPLDIDDRKRYVSLAIRLKPASIPDTQRKRIRKLQFDIPLANTVFQNGQRTTLLHYTVSKHYEERDDGNEDERWIPSSSEPLSGAGAWSNLLPETELSLQLTAPIVPLTVPRKVHAAYGNILRQLSCIDSHPFPASKELEANVSSYFKSMESPMRPVSVWALVLSAQTARFWTANFPPSEKLQELWRSLRNEPTILQHKLLDALTSGAKLVRVLSGGGGWGNQAGLLSLDPAELKPCAIRKTAPKNMTTDDDNHNDTAEIPFLSSSSTVAMGSYVQFFMLDETLNISSAGSKQQHDQALTFGTMPSLSETTVQHAEEQNEEVVHGYESFLGVLSEDGFVLTTDVRDVRHTTKIDVPHSRLVMSISKKISRDQPPIQRHDIPPKDLQATSKPRSSPPEQPSVTGQDSNLPGDIQKHREAAGIPRNPEIVRPPLIRKSPKMYNSSAPVTAPALQSNPSRIPKQDEDAADSGCLVAVQDLVSQVRIRRHLTEDNEERRDKQQRLELARQIQRKVSPLISSRTSSNISLRAEDRPVKERPAPRIRLERLAKNMKRLLEVSESDAKVQLKLARLSARARALMRKWSLPDTSLEDSDVRQQVLVRKVGRAEMRISQHISRSESSITRVVGTHLSPRQERMQAMKLPPSPDRNEQQDERRAAELASLEASVRALLKGF